MNKDSGKSEWIEIEALRAVYDAAPDSPKKILRLEIRKHRGRYVFGVIIRAEYND